MLVADLQHFLDLGPDTPGPARKLAEHLAGIVAAASAGDAHTPWETALPCRRRPATRRCPVPHHGGLSPTRSTHRLALHLLR
ncbi:hypothetical protein [Mycolicibacterium austroafricanum]|uniref:hypothetical protein n=1 Tax=Mycolicibacterium austroafricanum TaxID=39687 RepID=UPI001F217E11|nr:hypothetical protein [Mycolicibacterium austroafricanum]